MLRFKEILFNTQTRGTDPTSLYACIGEKVRVVVNLYSEIVTVANEDLKITFNPSPSEVRITTDTDSIILIDDSDFVANLHVGDSIQAVNTTEPSSSINNTYTVTEILSSSIIRVAEDLSGLSGAFLGAGGNDGHLVNLTPLKYFRSKFGVTQGGYTSPTTQQDQEASVVTDNAAGLQGVFTTFDCENIGGLEWQADTVFLIGGGDGEGTEQNIQIVHDFIVTPLFLATELDDLIAGIVPESWITKPKYQAAYEFAKTPDLVGESNKIELEAIGKFGYFNKKYDGGRSEYNLTSLVLTRVSDSQVVDALEYDSAIEVVATITKRTGTVNATDTKVVVGFNYLPQGEEFYTDNDRTLTENFVYDSQVCTIAGAVVNGVENGLATQKIKEVECNTATSTTFTVRFIVEFGTDIKPILRQDGEAWYNIWLIVENTDLVMPVSDKSSILLQTEKLYEQLVTIDLFDNDTVFIEHPYVTTSSGKETLEMFPVDDVVANSLITCDFTGKESDNIKIVSVEQLLVLTHATESDITLERNYINCENYPLVGSLPSIQDIDYVQDRPFQIPLGEIRKTIAFGRDYANDSGLVKAWGLSYPFMNRWEYWVKLDGVENIPSSLFSPSLDFKGINQNWNRLANVSGWTLAYRTKFTIEQNGVLFSQEFEDELSSQDFNSNTDWSNCTIKSFDSVTNTEITASGNKYLDSAKYTKVVCSFEKTSGDLPTLDGYTIVMWIERLEAGTIADIYRLSSEYATDDSGILKSIDGTGLVSINKTGAVYTGTCYVDNTVRPANTSKMTIYARIYETSTEAFNVRVTNDGRVRELLDASVRIIL